MVLARDVVGFEQRGPVRAVLLAGAGRDRGPGGHRGRPAWPTGGWRPTGSPTLTGRGVYYGANASDAAQVEGDDVYVVGAANSAGQAALNLARHAKRVVMVVRGGDLEATHVALPGRPDRGVADDRGAAAAPRWWRRRGDGHLESLTLADRDDGASEEVPASWLFVFIGASPRTDWLGADVARDEQGFVVTGRTRLGRTAGRGRWRGRRTPWRPACPACSPPATCGCDSMKRVASAVGEGAMAVHLVHRYLATI